MTAERANALLDEVGYLDSSGDGIHEDPVTGTPIAIELTTSLGGELRQVVTVHQAAWRIFADELPSLPLFPRVKRAVARPEVLNFPLDRTQNSELWNLFEIGLAP